MELAGVSREAARQQGAQKVTGSRPRPVCRSAFGGAVRTALRADDARASRTGMPTASARVSPRMAKLETRSLAARRKTPYSNEASSAAAASDSSIRARRPYRAACAVSTSPSLLRRRWLCLATALFQRAARAQPPARPPGLARVGGGGGGLGRLRSPCPGLPPTRPGYRATLDHHHIMI